MAINNPNLNTNEVNKAELISEYKKYFKNTLKDYTLGKSLTGDHHICSCCESKMTMFMCELNDDYGDLICYECLLELTKTEVYL